MTASPSSRSMRQACRACSSISPSGGTWPRFLLVLEAQRSVLVGNERSGTLAIFRIEPDGRLTATGQTLPVPGVVFVGQI
ncbi:beta-propeller fold lactonase family protein [Sphingomonas sp. H160509]|uniref:beta-propeller fold lactonase family protein n=1 Tax=Sphingomonas sp. H160509 TaxID=2955313 RepID=UPI0020975C8B|nr:beta-propeller fold lactonase family protein [Sphingomonas sp. H160509]MDD1450866.1 beta-propeller fold lactonase family protein [Sphingomonas sp. H160509]